MRMLLLPEHVAARGERSGWIERSKINSLNEIIENARGKLAHFLHDILCIGHVVETR